MILDIPPAVWWSTLVAAVVGLGGVLVALVRRVDVLAATVGALGVEVRGVHHRLGEVVDAVAEDRALHATTREEAAIERTRLGALGDRLDRLEAAPPCREGHLRIVPAGGGGT